VWELTGIFIQANITEAEIEEARSHLREYIKDDTQLKYIVMDWVDTYGRIYFIPRNCEGFDENLLEAERFVVEFPTVNGTWKGGIIICEIKKQNVRLLKIKSSILKKGRKIYSNFVTKYVLLSTLPNISVSIFRIFALSSSNIFNTSSSGM